MSQLSFNYPLVYDCFNMDNKQRVEIDSFFFICIKTM